MFVAVSISDFIEKYIKEKKLNNFLIIETSSDPTHLGSKIEDFEFIFKNLKKNIIQYVKICVDTAHIYTSGYPIDNFDGIINYFFDFHKKVGLDKLMTIHLNDSSSELYSAYMPHETIGKGNIFKNSLNFMFSDDKIETKLEKFTDFFSKKNYYNIQVIKSISTYFKIPVILERHTFDINLS